MTTYSTFAAIVLERPEREFTKYSEDQLGVLLQLAQYNTNVGIAVHEIIKESKAKKNAVDRFGEVLNHSVCKEVLSPLKEYQDVQTAINCITELDFPLEKYEAPAEIWRKLQIYRRYNHATREPSKHTILRRWPLEKFISENKDKFRELDPVLFGSVRYGDAKDISDTNICYISKNKDQETVDAANNTLSCLVQPGDVINPDELNQSLCRINNLDFSDSQDYSFNWNNFVEGIYLIGARRKMDKEKTFRMNYKVLDAAENNPIFSHILASKLTESLGKRMARK
tara:strand:- start:10372 stop:11220 length:849 start_codon:yes stop_codon:yes gene_type:complete